MCNPHIQESPHPRAPKPPKSLEKDFPGLPARSVKKVSKKSPNTDFGVFLTLFRVIWDFFGTFLTLRAGRPGNTFFDTFWGFRGSGVWRLLYMAAPIASIILFFGSGQLGNICRNFSMQHPSRDAIFLGHKIQGTLNGGGFKWGVSRSGLVLPFLSFFVLFGTFPMFPGFSRFARGWSGDFPDSSLFSFSAY